MCSDASLATVFGERNYWKGRMKKLQSLALTALLSGLIPAGSVLADNDGENADCRGLPSAGELRAALKGSGGSAVGGLFDGKRMWAATVNRAGQLCAIVASTDDPSQVWPGSQAIA